MIQKERRRNGSQIDRRKEHINTTTETNRDDKDT